MVPIFRFNESIDRSLARYMGRSCYCDIVITGRDLVMYVAEIILPDDWKDAYLTAALESAFRACPSEVSVVYIKEMELAEWRIGSCGSPVVVGKKAFCGQLELEIRGFKELLGSMMVVTDYGDINIDLVHREPLFPVGGEVSAQA